MYPKIEFINIQGKFRHLWLKYVQSVNLDVHCAKCLVGHYETKVNPAFTKIKDVELSKHPAAFYYLCGVSMPYVWALNFHLAFRYAEGKTIELNQNGIELKIVDAEQLPIIQVGSDCDSIFRTKKEYYTCRNWQFAWFIRNLVPCKEYQKEMPKLF